MFLAMLPMLVTAVEDAKHDARLQDKDIQIDLGLRHASDWSKVKKGERPFPFVRFLSIPSLRSFRIALWTRLLEAEREEQGQTTATDRDFVLAVLMKLDQIGQAVGIRKAAKADLKEIAS